MSCNADPFMVGQVYRQTKNNGLYLYTYFCNWTQSSANFFYTLVHGSMALPSSRGQRDEKTQTWNYNRLEDEMSNFLERENTSCSEPLWSRDRIQAELDKKRENQRTSLDYLATRHLS